jgi:hypothetical protein
MLLQNDRINVNARNHAGSTALAYSCDWIAEFAPDHHTIDSIKLLLSHPDIDPNISDNNGFGPLSKLLEAWSTGVNTYDRERTVQLLLAAGAR